MNLEQALKILGLTADSSPRDIMQAYAALAQPYVTASTAPATTTTTTATTADRAEREEAFKIVTADWTVADFIRHNHNAIPALSPFNCLIAGTKKLDEVGMLFLHIPVNPDYYTLGTDPMNFHLVTQLTSKGRYWVITSDANDTTSTGIPPQSNPAYQQAFQPLQLGFQFDASFNQIPNARMIPGFIRYAFEGITPRQLINAFYGNEKYSTLVPYLSSVTTDRLSDVDPVHYKVLQNLRTRLSSATTPEARRQVESDIRAHINNELTGESYRVEAAELTTQYSPEDITAIQTHMDTPSLATAPARFFSRIAVEDFTASIVTPGRYAAYQN